MPRQSIEILSTGNEILEGLYADANAQWLSARLNEMGLPVRFHLSVRDDPDDLREQLAQSLNRSQLVILSGGLGPTRDDLTRQTVLAVYKTSAQRDPRAESMIRERFAKRERELPENNLAQADLPLGCIPLYNHCGTAPGFIMPAGKGRGALICLPGPPFELHAMFEASARSWLEQTFPPTEARRLRVLHVFNRPESDVDQTLHPLYGRDEKIYLGLRAKGGIIDVRITARGATPEEANVRISQCEADVRRLLGPEDVFATDGGAMEEAVVELLKRSGKTIACAESCTAGMIAARLANVSGSSECLYESYITYSNEAKTRILGVRPETLAAHGAVSAQTAAEMARGARKIAAAGIALSVTGIAGPTGGSAEKPVGLTWFGLATDSGVQTVRQNFLGDRQQNRSAAALFALDLARRALLREQ
ncbi:competence/damage-inducible protein A [Candidatus Sumerlaeota bacterium]|nr:competence/damage-inducible protein A [Candidatus Sumerlaeota bacterium]